VFRFYAVASCYVLGFQVASCLDMQDCNVNSFHYDVM
jgi:hypothetical protein